MQSEILYYPHTKILFFHFLFVITDYVFCLWITFINIRNFIFVSRVLMNVIHRHFDEGSRLREWRTYAFSAIITFRKRGSVMAVKYTEEQLNNVDKSFLVALLLKQQEQMESLTKELRETNEKMQKLMEQLILSRQERFGRSSEKMDDIGQIRFMEVDGNIVFFNEAEAVSDLTVEEPQDLEGTASKSPKRKGKKEADLSGIPVKRIDHYLSEEELTAEFGAGGWKQLPDAISKKYNFIPAKVEVEEHHIGVYASKTDEHMVKADHPKALLHGSLVSPTIAAAIINGKYVNAVPLYRLEQEFSRYGLNITRQNMANWCIRLGEEYLSVLYDYLHKELYSYHVIQADETPVLVNRDGRKAGSQSYMCYVLSF